MTAAMTSRRRMLAAIHHERLDRVPVSPWGLGRIPMDSVLGAELTARTDPWVECGLGCHPVLGQGVQIETRRDRNTERRYLNANGRILTSTMTTTAATTASTEYYCKSLDDIAALMAMPYRAPEPDVQAFQRLKARIGDDGLVVMGLGDGLCFPNDMLGTEYCSYLWAAEPDVIRQMVRTAAERTHAGVERACRGGVDCFRIVGGEYATQLMGPRAWEELVVPYDGPLVETMHAYGAIAHYHNHGYMRRFIERIAALGIDSLDPIEQPPYGDMEMHEAKARIGDRVCLVGGLDDMEVLETRPTEEVLRMGAQLLERVGSVGYMLGGTSSGIYGEAAARHFISLVSVAERFG